VEINSNAPVISRHEITISAPLESVWQVHTEIDRWTQWNPDFSKAHLGEMQNVTPKSYKAT
jgi:ligand-binding SRPBCC domain-containing protein